MKQDLGSQMILLSPKVWRKQNRLHFTKIEEDANCQKRFQEDELSISIAPTILLEIVTLAIVSNCNTSTMSVPLYVLLVYSPDHCIGCQHS